MSHALSEGHGFFITRLAWLLLECSITFNLLMKTLRPPFWPSRLFAVGACLLPSVLSAHPGHYHPDETDEFDFLRATFFHSHGSLDYVIALIAIFSIAVAYFHATTSVRVSALLAGLGALAMLPIF